MDTLLKVVLAVAGYALTAAWLAFSRYYLRERLRARQSGGRVRDGAAQRACGCVVQAAEVDSRSPEPGDREGEGRSDEVSGEARAMLRVLKGQGEAEAKLILQLAINAKTLKLQATAAPKILLVHDMYVFGSSTMYAECARDLGDLAFFHSVFLIESAHDCRFLHTVEEAWQP